MYWISRFQDWIISRGLSYAKLVPVIRSKISGHLELIGLFAFPGRIFVSSLVESDIQDYPSSRIHIQLEDVRYTGFHDVRLSRWWIIWISDFTTIETKIRPGKNNNPMSSKHPENLEQITGTNFAYERLGLIIWSYIQGFGAYPMLR